MRTLHIAWNRSGPWAASTTPKGAWDAAVEMFAGLAADLDKPGLIEKYGADLYVDPIVPEVAA